MKGVILVGGMGTRLQPLTLTQPKPLIPFANKPIIKHQIEALAGAGVTEIILAVGHMQDKINSALKGYEEELGVRIAYSVEDIPMGTAGPLSLLRRTLCETKEPFFLLNSDVICNFPFGKMREYHQIHGGSCTILTTEVEDPARYGLVFVDADSCVTDFLEKAANPQGNRINAGVYLLSPGVLKYVRDGPMSLEREVLSEMAKRREIYAYALHGFWMDIGQPRDYLIGHKMYLGNTAAKKRTSCAEPQDCGASIQTCTHESGAGGGVHEDPRGAHTHSECSKSGKMRSSRPKHLLMHPTAIVSPEAVLGENTVLGALVVVEALAEIENAVIFEGSIVKRNAVVKNSVVGWNCVIGEDAKVEEYSVLGDSVEVCERVSIVSGVLPPNSKAVADIGIGTPESAYDATNPALKTYEAC